MQLPDFLRSGEVARLFPVISETGKERRASSILLSVMSAVPPFAHAILSQVGPRIGVRSSVNTFTEIVFKNQNQVKGNDRPDGLIEVVTGKRCWSALLEAKIGNATLSLEQLERYLQLARDNTIDAVITISNEFSALPTHHPVSVQKKLTRKVALYHFSWTHILTEAVLMHENSALQDPEQAFLLRELVRFFSHPSAGVAGFRSMPKEWGAAVDLIQAGGKVQKGEMSQEIVAAWHQELRDLTLLMSRIIGCGVSVKLSKTHAADADARARDDKDKLCSKGVLEALIRIPNAAADLKVIADLRRRSLRTSMTLDAPKDRKTTRARVNWLLRQFKDVDADGLAIGTIWASRAPTTVLSLADLRARPEIPESATAKSEIRAFEVSLTSNNVRRFMGRKTFVEELETWVPNFYERVGQHLQAWKPAPPRPKHSVAGDGEKKELGSPEPQEGAPKAGNYHTDLLEIPDFLQRNPS